MKSFDAVKIMRDARIRLSERYQKDAKQQIEDLSRVRKKYHIHPSSSTVEQPKVAEDEAKY